MPTSSSPSNSTRLPNGRFGPGNPGRRGGSRNRLSERVARMILEHFEANAEEVLDSMTTGYYVPAYIRLVSALLPRSVDIGMPDLAACSEAEIARRVFEARAALDRIEDGRGTLLDLEAVLLGEEEPAQGAAR